MRTDFILTGNPVTVIDASRQTNILLKSCLFCAVRLPSYLRGYKRAVLTLAACYPKFNVADADTVEAHVASKPRKASILYGTVVQVKLLLGGGHGAGDTGFFRGEEGAAVAIREGAQPSASEGCSPPISSSVIPGHVADAKLPSPHFNHVKVSAE